MNQTKNNKNGFTMVELIIVVAIMGVIGTLVVPAFGPMVAKAKITSDLATVKTLKRTADIYKTEQGTWPAGNDLAGLNTTLTNEANKYLDNEVTLQTAGADIIADGTNKTIQLDLTNCTEEDIAEALNKMDDQVKDGWIIGPSASNSGE